MQEFIYKALVVRENANGSFSRQIETLSLESLPQREILIKVEYSALNYKDALSASGNKGITRNYPHVPGIDAAGKVAQSSNDAFKPGDEVLVTGYDLGMNTAGGFGGFIRVPAAWVVPLPNGLTTKESMILGTAGFTAALCAEAIIKHEITPDSGKILVTGASGGVGSLAVAILSKLGYDVTASTGKAESHDFLRKIGANEIISREDAQDSSSKPLLKSRWAAVIDNVGGLTLSTAIRSLQRRGIVCSVGLTSSNELNITVYPFILRGAALVGIDSAETQMQQRLEIWRHLASDWKPKDLQALAKQVTLEEINREIDLILEGKQCGKVLLAYD